MNLESLFFVTKSIEAVIVTFFLLVFMYAVITVILMVKKVEKKVTESIDAGTAYAFEIKESIGRMINTIIDHFTYKLIRKKRR